MTYTADLDQTLAQQIARILAPAPRRPEPSAEDQAALDHLRFLVDAGGRHLWSEIQRAYWSRRRMGDDSLRAERVVVLDFSLGT